MAGGGPYSAGGSREKFACRRCIATRCRSSRPSGSSTARPRPALPGNTTIRARAAAALLTRARSSNGTPKSASRSGSPGLEHHRVPGVEFERPIDEGRSVVEPHVPADTWPRAERHYRHKDAHTPPSAILRFRSTISKFCSSRSQGRAHRLPRRSPTPDIAYPASRSAGRNSGCHPSLPGGSSVGFGYLGQVSTLTRSAPSGCRLIYCVGTVSLTGGEQERALHRMRDHAAATASRHWSAASARNIRSVDREVRWR